MSELTYLGFDPKHTAIARAAIPAGNRRDISIKVMLEELRRLCKRNDLNLGLIWSQIWHETAGFTSDLFQSYQNPAGIKIKSGSDYMHYHNGVDAARAMHSHVSAYLGRQHDINPSLDPRSIDVLALNHGMSNGERAKLSTVALTWAKDQNYAARVGAQFIRLFVVTSHYLPILIVAGHHNLSGGNPAEYRYTDDLARAYVAAGRAQGVNVEWWQSIDGDNDPDDSLTGLAGVATGANDWLDRQPNGGIMLDLHFEGGGAPGIFTIYPDWPGDVNPLDREWAGRISASVAEAVGLRVRTSGVTSPGAMSEKQSGVGGQGFRLGMFGLTASQRKKSIRLIIEHGSLDQNPDMAVIERMSIAEYAKLAAAAAINEIMELQQ